jgi:hypothetical protein
MGWVAASSSTEDLFKPAPATGPIAFYLEVPLRAVSMSNARMHWARKAKEVKRQREAVQFYFAVCRRNSEAPLPLPCTVLLTRVAPRELDDDNLRGALKAVRDQVATVLGVDDRDKRVRWEYAQAKPDKPKTYAVRIEIRPQVLAP